MNFLDAAASRATHSVRRGARGAARVLLLAGALGCLPAAAAERECDLLVVGGAEGGVAAAVQAARLGVPRIVLVNDIDWLGGQFTAEGLCAIDEWTVYRSHREYFPRSGLFLEIMDAIEADNQRKYNVRRPGNCFCAWTTCEPRDTERLFRLLVEPHLASSGGPLEILDHYEPAAVEVREGAVAAVRFVGVRGQEELVVRARLTIDASDWGDVVRLSGARYFCGPDPQDRFLEPSAPTDTASVLPNEMNPLTYNLVLRESEAPTAIDPPPHYDERRYFAATTITRPEYDRVGWLPGVLKPFTVAWKDTALPGGPYTGAPTVYHHRRLVDRHHFGLPPGTECVLVNWPVQDYPTYNFPQHVVDALEASETGASGKNLVDMTPAQRRIVFEDAKNHALGLLRHLQTTVREKQPWLDIGFHRLRLTDEFGTADKMPLKPYIREGLRTEALYVVVEQDVIDRDRIQSWAAHMVPDNVFGFQFNIDFHPTRRVFLRDDPRGPWTTMHTPARNWNADTDRAGFPLRGLVPRNTDGLLVAGKNLGVSSLVQSAVRLHAHGMHSGQAAGTIAALCLADGRRPREAAADGAFVRRVQSRLLSPPAPAGGGPRPPGVLLWPYHDVPPEAPHFVAANELAVRSILPGDAGFADFFPDRPITRREFARAVARAVLSVGQQERYDYAPGGGAAVFADVGRRDPDYAYIESLSRWGAMPLTGQFGPEELAATGLLSEVFRRLQWRVVEDVQDGRALRRGHFARLLWGAIADKPEKTYAADAGGLISLAPDFDTDRDGIPDFEDPLPRDRDNDNLPDLLDPDDDNDGLPD